MESNEAAVLIVAIVENGVGLLRVMLGGRVIRFPDARDPSRPASEASDRASGIVEIELALVRRARAE